MTTSTSTVRQLLDNETDYDSILRTIRKERSSVFSRPIDETPMRRPDPTDEPLARRMSRAERLVESGNRRDRVVAFVEQYYAKHFRPPTVREISAGADISSTSMVTYHLRALCKEGRLLDTGEHGKSRRYVPAWLPEAIKRELRRQMREMHKDDPFAEPNNGVLRPAVFDNYAALALREGEQPPAGWVELKCSEFTARIFVPSK